MEMFTKPIVALIIAGVLLVTAAGIAYLGLREFHSMLDEAAATATETANAKWQAKLEKADAEANRQVADQAKATLKIQATASEQVRQAEQQLEDREKQNEALPDGGGCGLSARRIQLLPD